MVSEMKSPFQSKHHVKRIWTLIVIMLFTVCVFLSQASEDCKTEPFESHSALEIAEQLTLLDHLVFKVIPYE